MGMDAAVMALIGISAAGYVMADGEKVRLRYIRAMRRSLMRIHQLIRYEQPPLDVLLSRIDLHATPEEKRLSALLRACGDQIGKSGNLQLLRVFEIQSAKTPGYTVLSREDRVAFESLLSELGQTGLREQLQLIDCADERLRSREEELEKEYHLRARLIRTLGVTGGAAAFLLLI